MILRSRKIPVRPPKEQQTPGKKTLCASPKTPQSGLRGQRALQAKSPSILSGTIRSGPVTLCNKKSILAQNYRISMEEEGIETPIRERPVRVHFQMDEPFPRKQDLVSSIYNPVVCYLNPRVGSSDTCCLSACKDTSSTTSLELPYFSHIPSDVQEEEMNPFNSFCNVPPVSCDQWQGRKEIPFKTRSAPENTLVLDLDEILIFSSLLPQPDAEFSFLIPFQDTYYKVYLKLRPEAMEFLETLCKVYEIFVFTTAKRDYAEKVLEILDPHKKLIRHRLYQDHCVCVAGHYVKDLSILQRDLAKTVALDTIPKTFPYQLSNRIPVQRWTGDIKDRELLSLISALEEMTHVEDIRLVSHRFQIRELEVED